MKSTLPFLLLTFVMTSACADDPSAIVGDVGTGSLAPENAVISMSLYHTCAVTVTEEVYCWGDNGAAAYYGLGVADTARNVNAPSRVRGGIALHSISEAETFRCGLTSSSQAYCWGHNEGGQLGNGTFTSSDTPQPVAGGITFISLSAAAAQVCGVATLGDVFCWGGVLDGPTNVPKRVPLPEAAVAIATAGSHTCARTRNGSLYCWGYAGPWLGNGDPMPSPPWTELRAPTRVATNLQFARLYVTQASTCALTAQGEAYCWGFNPFNALGFTGEASRPQKVGAAPPFVMLSMGWYHTCGLTAEGTAYCWGDNGYAQLGSGSLLDDNTPTPLPVATNLKFASLATGVSQSCGVTGAGKMYCWGSRRFYSLGDGISMLATSTTAEPVAGSISFNTVVGSGGVNCGLTNVGKAYCWGSNTAGTLGDGTTTNRNRPTTVETSIRFKALSVSSTNVCGLDTNGAAYCWGNSIIQNDNLVTTPASVAGNMRFASLAAGPAHVCGLTSDGDAYCWGSGKMGELGAGAFADSPSPQLIPGFKFTKIAAADRFTCAIRSDRNVYCWGLNGGGRLVPANPDQGCVTNPSTTLACASTPRLVSGVSDVADIMVMGNNVCALQNGGAVYCWGESTYYAKTMEGGGCNIGHRPLYCIGTPQLMASGIRVIGGNAMIDQAGALTSPVDEAGYLTGSRGRLFAPLPFNVASTFCGIATTGSTYCWGDNSVGQLGRGDGWDLNQTTPVLVTGNVAFASR